MDNDLLDQLRYLIELKMERHTLVVEIERKIEELEKEKIHIAEDVDRRIAALEEEIKPRVLNVGQSVKYKNINAVFVKRHTWDTDGLIEYAKENPSVLQFEKISESVHFRFRA